MFETTGDDIAQLSDAELRYLISLLCDAELASLGYSPSFVTASGDQDAPDGGVDVRVDLPIGSEIQGFIPRPASIFQVKKPSMPPSEIDKEMRPGGILRSAISDLTSRSGAYVIVSSGDSATDAALKNRLRAMVKAVQELSGAESLTMRFYDREQIARWVRQHAGPSLWVRSRIGKSIPGWQPYGNWACVPDTTKDEYLIDSKLRLRTATQDGADGLTAVQGIQEIRNRLRAPQQAVRLVGLSGTGKTRLVQALFDCRVGEGCLRPSLAVYTNLSDDPAPQPAGMISDFIASKKQAVVVVDNCPPDVHSRLSALCRTEGSTVSLITIEHDVRDDIPEGTDVFHLETASLELVETLLKRRFPNLSATELAGVARMSDGNARVAIVIAATVGECGSIAGLPDAELFRRLFHQSRAEQPDLLRIARACSLVYSFDVEQPFEGTTTELCLLGRLAGKSEIDMFAGVAELKRRDLVQARGKYRALLPHPIANRLAAEALQEISLSVVESLFCSEGPDRLFLSFTRRLGFLHDRKEAVYLVSKWLRPEGRLADLSKLNESEWAALKRVAPVCPKELLAAIERTIEETDPSAASRASDLFDLLRSLAYDAETFAMSVDLMIRLARLSSQSGVIPGDITDIFKSLFYIYLSGTQASLSDRLVVIERLLRAEHPSDQALGMAAFAAALETWYFSSHYDFAFGGRVRDYGYAPKDGQSFQDWFRSVLLLGENLASSGCQSASGVRRELARAFRGLWMNAKIYDGLERACSAITENAFWSEGWIAARETLFSEGLDPLAKPRLETLEKRLRPGSLTDLIRSVVLPQEAAFVNLVEEKKAGALAYDENATLARELGRLAAHQADVIDAIKADVLRGGAHASPFGAGLADAAPDRESVWRELSGQVQLTPRSELNISVLLGFLHVLQTHDPNLTDTLLETAVDDHALGHFYPILESACAVSKRGLQRLRRSLMSSKAPIEFYANLRSGRASDCVCPNDLSILLREIADRPGGHKIALQILSSRVYAVEHGNAESSSKLAQVGRELLEEFVPTTTGESQDYDLAKICGLCFQGTIAEPAARAVCRKLIDAAARGRCFLPNFAFLLEQLFSVQPSASLDEFVLCSENERSLDASSGLEGRNGNPIDVVPEEELFAWCDQEPHARYPTLARFISIAEPYDSRRWTERSRRLLERAPDKIEVLRGYISQFQPRGAWSGSLASTIESKARLLDQLNIPGDQEVAGFLATERERIAAEVKALRRDETKWDQVHDERFE